MRNDILIAGETVVREGIANRITINSNYATGGYLILTNLRIIYVITKHKEIDCVIPFSEIARKGDSFDIYSDTPNIVKIRDKNNNVYEFSVKKGEKTLWETEINKTLTEYASKNPMEESDLEEIVEEIEEVNDSDEVTEEIDIAEEPEKYTNKTEASPLMVLLVIITPIAGIFFEHGFLLFLLIGIGFCYWDESILHHSGYDTLSFNKQFIIPVYLFKRARLLKKGMEYFILWILTFITGIIFTFTSLSFWIKLLETIQTMITQS